MSIKTDQTRIYEGVRPVSACTRGHCPRCGKGDLYGSFLELAKKCDHCDLDL